MKDKKSKKKKVKNQQSQQNQQKQSFYNDQLGENAYDEFDKSQRNKS